MPDPGHGASSAPGQVGSRPTGAPFLRLDARTGWRLGPDVSHPGVREADLRLGLGVAGRSPIPAGEPFLTFGGRTLPRGLAVSADGRVFLAWPERRVVLSRQVGDPEHPSFEPLWPARPVPVAEPCDVDPPASPPVDPYVLLRPTDVALAPNGDLVIADPHAGRLLVLAFPSARLRHVIRFPGGAPIAIAFDHRGRAYVADPLAATVHRFDTAWRRDPAYPHPSATFHGPQQVASVAAGPTGLRPGRDLLVLDRDRIVRLDGRGRMVPADPLPALAPGPLRIGADRVLLHEDPDRPWLDPLPLTGIEVTADGRSAQTTLPLVAVPRRVELPRSGSFTSTELDGGRPGFDWDRIVLRVDLPANTRLLLRTLTADSLVEFGQVLATPDDAWSAPLPLAAGDVPELLVQSGAGRYLWLRVELFGDGVSTPAIAGIDVFGPRRSSIRHLPASYQQDPESRAFLDRFLSYFDTVFAEISARNAEVAALFDPWAVPDGDALAWLGSWFDLEFLAEWSPQLRRRLVAEATASARQRGTVTGIERILRLHTGLRAPMPRVIEHFRLLPDADIPIGGELLPEPGAPHRCTVVLPAAVVPDAAARDRIVQLLAEHVPGHVRVDLRVVQAGFVVGRQATLGVDTVLGPAATSALGAGRLGTDLTTTGPAPQGLVPELARTPGRSQPC